MKKIVLTFGLISGGMIATFTGIIFPLCMNGTLDLSKSEVFGYTIMFLAFLMVFFGIRSYRENVGAGTITFGKAFQVGIFVTLIACGVYVLTWEIVYHNFLPDFEDRYATIVIQKMRVKDATPAAIEKRQQEMARFKVLYKKPFNNVGITFLEVFPIGLVMTLISAAILKRKTPRSPAAALAETTVL